jgi:hypothetical protein
MSSIQDIHALEMRIMDMVYDCINYGYDENQVLTIADESYPVKDLIRIGDDGNPEADNDKISDIANSWLFLD